MTVATDTGDETLTQQCFKDECDINKIIDTHARTGIVTHVAGRQPQYGDVSDVDFFESACAQAAIRSAVEDGWEPPEDAQDDEPEGEPEETEIVQQAASEAAEVPEVLNEGT